MCIKGSLGPCPLFVHWPYRRSPSPKFRGSSSFPICWVKSGPSVRAAGAGGQRGASRRLQPGSASILPGEPLVAADRRRVDGQTWGLRVPSLSLPPPCPLSWCLVGLSGHAPLGVGWAREETMLPAAPWKVPVSGPPGQHTHSRSHTYSCTSTHCQLTLGPSTAALSQNRHLTGAIFMGDNKNYRWKNSLLVPRSFHLLVSSDLQDSQEPSR